MKKILLELLLALREAREDLVSRTIKETPQLFSSLFQYENNENLLSLSFQREYSIFINDNLEKLSIHITNAENSDTKKELKFIVEQFVSFKQIQNTSVIDTFFLNDKIEQIEKIFSIFDKDSDRIEEINYIRKKEQVLFERKFKILLGEKDELVE
ncbi:MULTISPECIES: hypothetical protein [Providencia]|uniref:Uncharacterized protein n=1 Tax=Providencia rettgeri TaxID=587 RepID=A0AAJ4THV7_PRORE|nr:MULTISPECIES: hypothetical protein [Providencia]QWQ16528.1 hypothetical protein KOL65_17465 [Providencia rettgeri]QWQ20363.1 hypothetical protein KOF27_17485 [Providencia rettgeri]QWQ24198.1 hypothetical protein KOL64_17470 [Providencia rettgeri]